MTAVRCTMSDTMYIGRTTGQLVRIALRSLSRGGGGSKVIFFANTVRPKSDTM